MVHAYIAQSNPANLTDNVRSILAAVLNESQSPHHLIERVCGLLQDTDALTGFMGFINQMADRDSVWNLWVNFVFSNCYCYITLFLVIRGSNWKLRLSSLKQTASIFAAFDQDTYERIIPSHLADLKQYPASILKCLEVGCFTVSITGKDITL